MEGILPKQTTSGTPSATHPSDSCADFPIESCSNSGVGSTKGNPTTQNKQNNILRSISHNPHNAACRVSPTTATPSASSRDAWSSLRGSMSQEEMIFETSQRAKVYNRNHFGLLGILKVIRMTDPDLNVLALGTDLTSLGLNLNSAECLYTSFSSPLADVPSRKEITQLIPNCFMMPTSQLLKVSHFERFSDLTLLYIFYACPKLLMQGCAAVELCRRQWNFHQTSCRWFLAMNPRPEESGTQGNWVVYEPHTHEKVVFEGEINPNEFLSPTIIRASLEEGYNRSQQQQQQQQTLVQQLQHEHHQHVTQQLILLQQQQQQIQIQKAACRCAPNTSNTTNTASTTSNNNNSSNTTNEENTSDNTKYSHFNFGESPSNTNSNNNQRRNPWT